MNLEYYRPKTIDEALALLARQEPLTLPLAGGTVVNQPGTAARALVDLQDLGLDTYLQRGNTLELGAMLTLQSLLSLGESGELSLPGDLTLALEKEASYNLRQAASLAGTLVAADGRSPLATAMLALEAVLTLLPGDQQVTLGDLLPVRSERLGGCLISQVSIPSHVKLAYEAVARSPADRPIVCAAVAMWPGGRVRVALGGYGRAPLLAFDGAESGGVDIAARSAYSQAGDEWAGADYRSDVAGVLAQRCLNRL
jgi:CO/xanthine dehydrogenase FAD-binding subunit